VAGRPETTPARVATMLSAGAVADVVADVTAEHEPTTPPSTMRAPQLGAATTSERQEAEPGTTPPGRPGAQRGAQPRIALPAARRSPVAHGRRRRRRTAAPPHQPPASSSGPAGGDGDRSKRHGGGRRGQSLGDGEEGRKLREWPRAPHHVRRMDGKRAMREAGSGRRARRG
jgi:hypothetical protein